MASRVAAALGARELRGESLTETLATRLRYARALLVLDNCEHLIDSTAALTAELLRGCAGLRVLATSRAPLGVAGETVVPVDGLQLPAADTSYSEAIGSEAVRLLADRGAAARAGFTIEPGTVGSAIAVCRRLDGLPLAIEIAAALLRILTLPELERRLDRRLDLHWPAHGRCRRGTAHSGPPSSGATTCWSKDERALFRRLAVFTGGFSLAAGEQIGADPDRDPPHQPAEVLEVLSRLVHRSLVVPDLDETRARYRMLETVGEFAAEQLAASADEQPARRRHAAWYRRMMADAPLFGSDEHEFWVRQVPDELDNLRAAMDWSLTEDGNAEQALAIGAPLRWYWWSSGQMTEGRDRLRRALSAAGPVPASLRGEALRAAETMARVSGDLTEARALGEQDLALQQEHGDAHGLADASDALCLTATAQADFDAALAYAAASRAEREQLGDERALGWTANSTGMVLRCLGRFEEAEAGHREALELHTRAGDHRGQAVSIYLLAFVAARRGRPEQARDLYLQSLVRYRELQMTEAQVDVLEGLACLDLAAGDPAQALGTLRIAERERRRLGVPLTIPDEVEMVGAAVAAATEALDAGQIARITEAAAGQTLAATVEALISPP